MPDRSETLFESAVDAAAMLAQKQISSRQLTEMLLARIDAVNPALNAVVELRAEEAMKEGKVVLGDHSDRTGAAIWLLQQIVDHVQNEERPHSVIGKALPHLGGEQKAQPLGMAKEIARCGGGARSRYRLTACPSAAC